VIGEAEIVVAGEIDDFTTVIVAHGRLLIIEDAQLEVGSPGAQVIKNVGQIGKLGTSSGLRHSKSPQPEKDSAFGGE
jgi:hypothetical protein